MAEVDVVVIGAGAGGIMAAWRAAGLGAKTVLLEKTARIGTKILISGGGKCNITHDGPLENVLKAFRPNEARFIRPACYRLTNQQIVDMLTSRGLRVYTRPDGRIFPVDQTAKDVVAILRTYLDEAKVDVRLETRVLDVVRDEIGVAGVKSEVGTISCRHVVLAVGGSSYPSSGTTGDGWPWATRLGHSLAPIRAALAPIVMAGQGERAGIALRDIVLKARAGGKELTRWRGDLLFTHRGISGPTVLGISRMVSEALESGPVTIEVDLAPNETFEELSGRLRAWLGDHPKKLVRGFLDQIVPQRLEEPLLAEAGISPTVIGAHLPQKQRNRLVEVLKGWRLGDVDEVWLDKGEVVAGGVALDEVDPQTMRSLKCPGLYLCGEVLDIAGPVGGYNLQAAFATGYLAGETAAKEALLG